uniref:Col_cuticle_N domain-containing protein n=1 Tax=Steinernema glaseri TaxID=37863 RepID=A0A1I7XZP1_9BILA
MRKETVIVGIASSCSVAALITCLLVLPPLISLISNLRDEVVSGVQGFRVDTDSAWNDMMQVQMTVNMPVKRSPVDGIFHKKREAYKGLPNYCLVFILSRW